MMIDAAELERATCRGCAAPVAAFPDAAPGYCCGLCALGMRCPCERLAAARRVDQPRLFDPPPPVTQAPS
jgi:hypothetical protein